MKPVKLLRSFASGFSPALLLACVESPGARPQQSGVERVLCLDANTGDEVWSHEYERDDQISYANKTAYIRNDNEWVAVDLSVAE